MNKSLWQFISMLVIAFALIIFYSFQQQPIKIYDVEIKQSKVKDFIWGDPIPTHAFAEFSIFESSSHRDTVITDTTKQRILLIGDSMLEGLMLRMRDYVAYNGHDLKTVIWYSSSSLWYGTSDTISYFIKKYKPTYVMLVLGANELFIRDIKNKRLRYVKRIISQMDTLPYVWVGPPNWKDDTGINDLILDNAGETQYFPSKDLSYDRTSDGAHPTHKSAAHWMDSVAMWVQTESSYRIDLDRPPDSYNQKNNYDFI